MGSLLDLAAVTFILGTEAATYFEIPAYFVKLEAWAEELRESLSSTEIAWTWRTELSDRLKKTQRNSKHKHVNVTSAISLYAVFYMCENSSLSCKSENFGVETDDRN